MLRGVQNMLEGGQPPPEYAPDHTCIRYGLSVYYFIPKYRVHLYTSECTFWTALFAILQSFDLEHDFGGVVRTYGV